MSDDDAAIVKAAMDWFDWMTEQWAVVPLLHNVPRDKKDTPAGWVIVLRRNVDERTSDHIGPVHHNEELARHIARAHNCYLSVLRNEGIAGDYTAPTSGRTPEP